MRTTLFATAMLLLTTGSVFGASKEQLEMQRDIAQMQDQLRTLQSTVDQKLTALQVLVQQALDAASRANTSVSVLNAGVTSTLERELKQALTPVAGLAAKVDNTNNDVAEVRNQVQDLNTSMNRITQTLTDINNAIKVMQAPPAPAPTAPGGAAPPPPADVLFQTAFRDENGGKYDLAVSEFQDFIKYYPDNPNAARAQYNIGECHYTAQKFDQAAADHRLTCITQPIEPGIAHAAEAHVRVQHVERHRCHRAQRLCIRPQAVLALWLYCRNSLTQCRFFSLDLQIHCHFVQNQQHANRAPRLIGQHQVADPVHPFHSVAAKRRYLNNDIPLRLARSNAFDRRNRRG